MNLKPYDCNVYLFLGVGAVKQSAERCSLHSDLLELFSSVECESSLLAVSPLDAQVSARSFVDDETKHKQGVNVLVEGISISGSPNSVRDIPWSNLAYFVLNSS